jgi:hypothetical protein
VALADRTAPPLRMPARARRAGGAWYAVCDWFGCLAGVEQSSWFAFYASVTTPVFFLGNGLLMISEQWW